jgi:hypothetical protein
VARRKGSPIRATDRTDKKRVAQRFRSHETAEVSAEPGRLRHTCLDREPAVTRHCSLSTKQKRRAEGMTPVELPAPAPGDRFHRRAVSRRVIPSATGG